MYNVLWIANLLPNNIFSKLEIHFLLFSFFLILSFLSLQELFALRDHNHEHIVVMKDMHFC